MIAIRSLLFILCTTAFTFVCANPFENQTIIKNSRGYIFEMHGSNTIGATLAPALVEKWLVDNGATQVITRPTNIENEKEVIAQLPNQGEVKVFIAAHGSGTGFKQIQAGIADVAAASRPAKAKENDLFPGTDVTAYESELVLAIDGIAVIINPSMNIGALSISDVGKLFSGQITNWQALGGPNVAVNVHARDDKSGTFDTFNTLVLKRGFSLTSSALRYESNDQLSAAVARTPGSIGFTSLASINQAKSIAIIDGQSQAMLPETSAIAVEDYPLARRLYLYQVETNNRYAKSFLTFAKSRIGQEVVSQTGFVSQNLAALKMPVTGELPAGYAFITDNSLRVTTNFRFKPNTKLLDNKALDDLQRLLDFMNLPENQDKKVILIGFSNQQKDEFKARLQSEARVIRVKRELSKIGLNSSALTGYGQIKPVAANDDIKYALRNQRVEVWIR